MASKLDCFYIHPTDSLAETASTGLAQAGEFRRDGQNRCSLL
jgi:hypothetical protein